METLGINFEELIVHAGLWSIFAIIFAESGLLIGFFLPGDTLLFTAGFLAASGYFSIWYLIIGGIIAAVVGDNVGYQIGRKFGPRIFSREESFFFHKDHVEKAKSFYAKHGPLTIVLARFVPVVRTFAPVLAGVGHMNYATFFFYNILGGVIWIVSMSLLGYFLGEVIPNIDKYVLPVILSAVVLSIVIPPVAGLLRKKRDQKL